MGKGARGPRRTLDGEGNSRNVRMSTRDGDGNEEASGVKRVRL